MSGHSADVLWLAEVIGNVRIAALVVAMVAGIFLPAPIIFYSDDKPELMRWLRGFAAVFGMCAFLAVMLPSPPVARAVLEARQ